MRDPFALIAELVAVVFLLIEPGDVAAIVLRVIAHVLANGEIRVRVEELNHVVHVDDGLLILGVAIGRTHLRFGAESGCFSGVRLNLRVTTSAIVVKPARERVHHEVEATVGTGHSHWPKQLVHAGRPAEILTDVVVVLDERVDGGISTNQRVNRSAITIKGHAVLASVVLRETLPDFFQNTHRQVGRGSSGRIIGVVFRQASGNSYFVLRVGDVLLAVVVTPNEVDVFREELLIAVQFVSRISGGDEVGEANPIALNDLVHQRRREAVSGTREDVCGGSAGIGASIRHANCAPGVHRGGLGALIDAGGDGGTHVGRPFALLGQRGPRVGIEAETVGFETETSSLPVHCIRNGVASDTGNNRHKVKFF